MGRTIATFHQLIEQTQARFAKFRRALRREDQQVFDELFARVKYYAASGSFEAAWEPLEVIFLAMLIEQQKALRTLEARLTSPTENLAGQRQDNQGDGGDLPKSHPARQMESGRCEPPGGGSDGGSD